jgi:hypothetical protein
MCLLCSVEDVYIIKFGFSTLECETVVAGVKDIMTRWVQPNFVIHTAYFTLSQFSLDIKLSLVSCIYRRFELWVFQGGCHPLGEELIHLLRCTSNERARIQQRVELILDRVKIRILSHAFNQVVLFSEFFYLVRGFMRQYLSAICARSCVKLRRGEEKSEIAP